MTGKANCVDCFYAHESYCYKNNDGNCTGDYVYQASYDVLCNKVESLTAEKESLQKQVDRMKSCLNCSNYDRNYKEGDTTCKVWMYCTDKKEKWEA